MVIEDQNHQNIHLFLNMIKGPKYHTNTPKICEVWHENKTGYTTNILATDK